MTVTFVGKYPMLEKVGVDKDLLAKMKEQGITFSAGYKAFSFHKNAKPVVTGALPAPQHLIMNSVTNTKAMAELKVTLTDALQQALKFDTGGQIIGGGPSDEGVANALAVVAAGAPAVTKPALPAVGGVIPLREALTLYQRVKGTSAGSVYVVVGLTKSLALAARVHGATLSIRVEPREGYPVIHPSDIQALAQHGLDLKKNGSLSYMSCHYTSQDVTFLSRVLGSVLVGSGLELLTPVPLFTTVAGLSS